MYKIIFKYGVYLSAFLFSIIILIFFPEIAKIKNFSLKNTENIIPQIKAIEDTFWERNSSLNAFENLQFPIIDGKILLDWDTVFSEDNILIYKESLVLPRVTNVSQKKLDYYYNFYENKTYNPAIIDAFYKEVLLYPLVNPPVVKSLDLPKLYLKWNIRSNFSLDCLENSSKNSPICKFYVNEFLDTFPYYKLDAYYLDFKNIVSHFSSNPIYHQKICAWINKMLQLWAEPDTFLRNIVYDCEDTYRNEYLLWNDFEEIKKWLSIGYINNSVYASSFLNYYKLLSTQQLLLKQIRGWESIASLLSSYLSFLKEFLIKDSASKEGNFFGSFYKGLTYWFNNQILLPVLNNESSKITKEQKSALLNDLLIINNWNKNMGFIWLQTSIEGDIVANVDQNKNTGTPSLDLEKIFKDNYLPPQFALHSSELTWENSLKVMGIDKKSELDLILQLKFEWNILYVEKIEIITNEKLADYLNILLKNNRYTLTRVLGLIEEHQDIAIGEVEKSSLCVEMKEKYSEFLFSCSPTTLVLKNEEEVAYTFHLINNQLVGLNISDKILEKQILASIEFSEITATNSKVWIHSIFSYRIEDEEEGYGIRASLQVLDSFRTYLNVEPDDIVHDHGVIRVYFTVQNIKFIARYDLSKNILSQVGFDVWVWKDWVVIKNFELAFSKDELEKINSFIFDPLATIKKINSTVVEKYFGTWAILLPKDQW